MQPLTLEQIKVGLNALPGWESRGNGIHKQFGFGDFTQAFGWMTSVALCAERMNHHPEWQNVYNRVSVTLSTHDAGGVTQKDFQLAKAMDESYARFSSSV
ncbi:MAG TPA: 4a-hydroxytetrahydrobiopterin dehydratase [Polyangiaceae bacterium]|jgi:4a-hydroxytetrahydrobiopterin dehydratase|nr:4a-hydroxytetrahydrobiopterin dehydratase [Polyangiaceae bacterium]